MPQAGGDGISSVTWSPTSNILISTNWDGGVRCWEVQEQVGQIQAVPKAQGESFLFVLFHGLGGWDAMRGGECSVILLWIISFSNL